MAKVSIIVPCWGVEKYLDQCLDSLVNQTLKDIEIILIDDKSYDKTPELCDKWMQMDKRIKVLHKTLNEGLGLACNTGLIEANGEYVAFCDSDDWVDLNMYDTLYEEAIKNDFDVVYSGLKRMDSAGKFQGFLPHPSSRIEYVDKLSIIGLLKDMICAIPSSINERNIQVSAKVVLYRNRLIKDNNIKFVSERQYASEDLIFNLAVLNKAARVLILPDIFYNYRINETSISHDADPLYFSKLKALFIEINRIYCNLDDNGDIAIRIQKMFIGYTRSFLKRVCTSKLSFKEKYNRVSAICNDGIWLDIWRKYPVSETPLKQRLFSLGLKYKQAIVLTFVVSLL